MFLTKTGFKAAILTISLLVVSFLAPAPLNAQAGGGPYGSGIYGDNAYGAGELENTGQPVIIGVTAGGVLIASGIGGLIWTKRRRKSKDD